MTASLIPAKKAKLPSNATIPTNVGKATGLDLEAAHLLFTISRWWPHTSATFKGQPFIANTMAWWQAQSELTQKVVKTRMAVLRHKGFIRTTIHKFHGVAMTYLQLSAVVVDGKLVALPAGQLAPGRTVGVIPNGPSHLVPPGTVLKILEDQTGISTGKELAFASAQATPSSVCSQESSQGEIEPMVSVADFAKLAEATKKAVREKNKNLKVDPSTEDKPGKAYEIWAQCMGELGEYVGPMISEDGGRLKQFIAKCPPGTANALIAFAVHKWASFASVLRKEYGVFKVSEKPVIGVIQKHADALVTYWMKSEQQKAAKEAVQTAKAVSAPTLPGTSAKPAQQQKSGGSVKVKDPATDPSSHLFKFNFAIEQFGLEYAKDWSIKNYGCPFPESIAIDYTETDQ